MTANVMNMGVEIFSLLGSTFVLLVFALALPLHHKSRTLPGSSGHREADDVEEHEEIRPDGYIDEFAGTIEEAGGSLPWVLIIAIPGILLWWLIYMILFMSPTQGEKWLTFIKSVLT